MPAVRSAAEVRQSFLDFFREKGHTIVPSAPLVPQGDATLLFINSGMAPFKDVFLGEGSRPYTRVADTQKCLRVSGKHNDLEEVGHDTYHHTLFEMLGNWSFGDYFKAEAIAWAWELLTERWGLDPRRLYVTVHEGDAALGLTPDNEAADLWKEQRGLEAAHILPGSTKDNFWMMGDTGPCGPCTEVHVDLRPDDERQRVDGATLVNTGDPRVIEIWNLVFIQYNAQSDGSLVPLPSKHVDTGMGFERVVAALQGAASNYDTDVFTPTLDAAAALSPRSEIQAYDRIEIADATEAERVRVALRVVADHLRAVSFAIADGVLPGNTGRGYVIRRILRRAVRYGYQTLDLRAPFLVRLVPVLADHMGEAFPELRAQQGYIERVVRAEEEAFLETLGTGLQAFGLVVPHLEALAAQAEMPGPDTVTLDALRRDTRAMDFLGKAYGAAGAVTPDDVVNRFAQSAAEREVPGEVAFLLHDTYGFPLDLTALMAREVALGVGMAAYDALMQQQKARARAAGGFKVDLSMTDDWCAVHGGEGSAFVGYDRLKSETRIVAVRTLEAGEGAQRHEVVLEETPFYAESGGQVADTGVLRVGDETLAVLDVQRQAGRVVHVVERLPVALDADVTAEVDAARRQRIQRHHTATHLLHAGLRHVLGTHVSQKGSLVAPDRLRFDFSHFERVSPDQLREVERYVNAFIQDNVQKREDRDVPIQEALGRGAMALFGEKYGEHVRVITFDAERSVELCGGTHVGATGEIGVFRFVAEGSVAAGIRRVEALAGGDALESLWRDLDDLVATRTHFRGLRGGLSGEVEALIEQNRRLERTLEESRLAMLQDRLEGIAQRAEVVGEARLAAGRVDGASMDALRELAQRLQQRLGDGGVALLGGTDETGTKALLAVAVADDLVARGVQAGKLVGVLAKHVGGGGGGRPNVATAGGRDPEGLAAALAAAPGLVADLLG
jgi:alanyl-tRNA synthetase